MSTHVLVTGGLGFLGSHLVNKLVTAGAKITILDDLSNPRGPAPQGVSVLIGSIESLDACRAAVKGAQVVFHLATVPETAPSDLAWRVDALGTMNMMVAAAAEGVKRFVYASSADVYGNCPAPQVESGPKNPLNDNASIKLAGESQAMLLGEATGMATIGLRFFSIYGPNMRPTTILGNFIEREAAGLPLQVVNGTRKFDFVHVDDAVTAAVAAVNRPMSSEHPQIYNIGTGVSTSVNELAHMISPNVEKLSEAHTSEQRADLLHTRADLKWEPARTLRAGLIELMVAAHNRENVVK